MNIVERFKRRRLIKRVNSALGVELSPWQIAYIFDDIPPTIDTLSSHRVGNTTAAVLRLLLNPKFDGISESIFIPSENDSLYYAASARAAYVFGLDSRGIMRRSYFTRQLQHISRELKRAHIKTNSITIKTSCESYVRT